MEISKQDWKLFKDKIGDWQESYMEKRIHEYINYLKSDLPASVKFWELENKIKHDKNEPGVMLELRKGDMLVDIIRLLKDGAITMNDLEIFSSELIEIIDHLYNGSHNHIL